MAISIKIKYARSTWVRKILGLRPIIQTISFILGVQAKVPKNPIYLNQGQGVIAIEVSEASMVTKEVYEEGDKVLDFNNRQCTIKEITLKYSEPRYKVWSLYYKAGKENIVRSHSQIKCLILK